MTPADSSTTLLTVRRILFIVLLGGMVGTLTELLLLDHVEEPMQLVPVVLLAVAVLAFGLQASLPARLWTRLFRATMILFVVAGAVGIVLHYHGASEFQLEVDPTLKGAALFWKSVRATAPPALAPASMTGLGLIGLAYMHVARRA